MRGKIMFRASLCHLSPCKYLQHATNAPRCSKFTMKFVFQFVTVLSMIFTVTSFSRAAQNAFVIGADVSSLTFNENRGVKYLDAQGETNLLQIAQRNG